MCRNHHFISNAIISFFSENSNVSWARISKKCSKSWGEPFQSDLQLSKDKNVEKGSVTQKVEDWESQEREKGGHLGSPDGKTTNYQ